MLSTGTNTEKSTLLFGGTFDPVHKGHLYILDKAIELSGYERIIIMPAFISNFKPGTHPADAMQRYEMLSLALEDFDSRGTELVLSDWEIRKGGVSYTYDTVCQIYGDVTQLPDAVRRYIEEHGLYYAGKDCQGC